MFRTIHDLYVSPDFRKLREGLMNERTSSEDGVLYCAHCHKPIVQKYDCIAHHVIEVTTGNLNDMSVTLNPENIQLVHHRCHNEIHRRFGRIIRKVYMVWGAPRAGKTTYVESVKDTGDMVVDIDAIWKSIGDGELEKPNALKPVVFSLRDAMYDAVLKRLGSWGNAYIITTRPDMRLCDKLGAELVYIPAEREECIQRCTTEAWRSYVEAWFDHPPLQAISEASTVTGGGHESHTN